MRKTFEDICAAVKPPATGIAMVLLSIVWFILVLMALIAIVRVVMG